ncbi:MAG: hypothetical protein II719_01435 [Clostridia bacterium]|nr:hypothetical protein [Clostridia bacterium]
MKKEFLVAGCLLAVLAAASCGSEQPAEISPESSRPASEESQAAETEPVTAEKYDIPEPPLPALDYGGADFTILSEKPYNVDEKTLFIARDFLISEGLTAEPVNDAVFNRNLMVEQKFNLKIRLVEPDVRPDTLVLGGEPLDIIEADSVTLGDSMGSGAYQNMMDLPYVNLEAEYWSPLCVQGTRMDNKLYMMPSDITMLPLASTGFIYFNKRILNEHDLENPYSMVYNNTWTVDNFLSMVRSVSGDLNGDGEMGTEDLYGYLPIRGFRWGCFLQFFFGSGLTFTREDPDEGRVLAVDQEKAQVLIDKLREVLEDHSICVDQLYCQNKFGDIAYFQSMFLDGHALFTESDMTGMDVFREMEDDFGIVPNPKYDETQEGFFHRVSPHVPMFALPATAMDLEKTGAVMEYMSWLSHYTVLPAYYEITVKQKRVRDEDAVAMLDIIRKTMVFEFGDVYDTHIPNQLSDAYDDGSIARKYGASIKYLTKMVKSFVAMLRRLE